MSSAIAAQPVFQARMHLENEESLGVENRIKKIFDRVIDGLTFLPKTLWGFIHRIVGIPVYPAPLIHKESQALKDAKELFKEHLISFQAADGTILSGAHFVCKDVESPKTMIYFLGNADNFLIRSPDFIQKKADDLGVNIFIFNYRGNYPSLGTRSKDGLILDGDAAFQYVRSLGINESDIILHGASLGGAIAAEVAAMHPQVNFCIERSFSKLSDEIKYLFGGGVIGKIIASIAKVFGWEFDSLASWDKIQGKKWVIYTPFDGVIRPEAQFAQHIVKHDDSAQILTLRQRFGVPRDLDVDIDNPQEVKKAYQTLGLWEHNYDIFDSRYVIDFYRSQLSRS